MRQPSSVIYLAIDDFISSPGALAPGLEDFLASLEHAGTPCVWLTSKTRLQIDEPRRKMAHNHPFIAEDGCGVYLPEDYFHLKPQAARSRKARPVTTIRLGRFTCLPIAEPQPAATVALEELAEETGVSVVALRSLRPRELAENTGLRQREAESARQRDFDELFFFAGARPTQIDRFREAARTRRGQLRSQGALWSLAIGASVRRCIQELSKLYDRALHAHARSVGITTEEGLDALLSACDRSFLLTAKNSTQAAQRRSGHGSGRVLEVPSRSPDKWERVLDYVIKER